MHGTQLAPALFSGVSCRAFRDALSFRAAGRLPVSLPSALEVDILLARGYLFISLKKRE